MSIKIALSALAIAAVASTAVFAQTAQQPAQPTNPLRQTAPTAPAAPAVQRPAAPVATAPAAQQRPATVPVNQLVNLNTAPASELDKLPQIGEARSKAIIAGRPYRDWADFAGRNVIPKNAEDAINGRVRFR